MLAMHDVSAIGNHLRTTKSNRTKSNRNLPVFFIVFPGDHQGDIDAIREIAEEYDARAAVSTHFTDGGAGAAELAAAVAEAAEEPSEFRVLYPDDMRLWDKVRTVAQAIYGADDIMGDKMLRSKFRRLEDEGYGNLPVCIAKTQYSLSTDPGLKGRPRGFDVPIRDVKVSAGAGFVVIGRRRVWSMSKVLRLPCSLSGRMSRMSEVGTISRVVNS